MTTTKIVFACDESGAKGYADQTESFPGEVGVFAGILVRMNARPLQGQSFKPSLISTSRRPGSCTSRISPRSSRGR